MAALLRKTRFYFALCAARFGARRSVAEIGKGPFAPTEALARGLRVYFWAPHRTPGANVIIYDMLPTFLDEIHAAGLDWQVQAGAALAPHAVDLLVCFKAIPDASQIAGSPRRIFLVCDQAEDFWDRLGDFDLLVATASRELAALFASRHGRVSFIGESEPPDYLAFGVSNLLVPPALRGPVLMWHGGHYSLDALYKLRPALERMAAKREMQLHVISGQEQESEERWGPLLVRFFPWSKEQLFGSAAQARLGLVPARRSIRLSWLKPGSRVRCLYALGVPAIGDAQVPDAARFLAEFDGPIADGADAWERELAQLWDSPERLQALATAGHAAVASNHSSRQTARQWIRFLSAAATR